MPPATPASLTIERIVPIPIRRVAAIGDFVSFGGLPPGQEHFAIRFGAPAGGEALVRVHSECATGDLFGSERCDCGAQLDEALTMLAREGGYLLYLRQEGRGIGLNAKFRAYALQDSGRDTYQANIDIGHPPDGRDYGIAAAMLRALGVTGVTLLTNNPAKATALRDGGIAVALHRTGVFATAHNRRYLQAKHDHGHALDLADADRSTET